MDPIEKYSVSKLSREISEIQTSARNLENPDLSIYEKALIYKYSSDGYEDLNEKLRKSKGKNNTLFGKFLDKVLANLPNFSGLVYRSANLSKPELQRYIDSLAKNKLLKEYSFVSSSKSKLIASAFRGNVLFRIYSRTGKEIEKFTKFGVHGYPNEREVLFRANRNFRILEITHESSYTLITMEEV